MRSASFVLLASFALCALFAPGAIAAEGVPTGMDPGRTDDEILAYMVQRYGDFVLYQPPFKATTVLLWAGPALLVFGGAFVLARNLRRRQVGDAHRQIVSEIIHGQQKGAGIERDHTVNH